MQQNPPAAWYPDTQIPGTFRWFDGAQWTHHTSSPQQPAGAHPSDVTHWLLPVGRSWQSIAAGYLGLLSFVVLFLGPVAFGFGIWALRLAGRTGTRGRGRSVFGIVGGAFGTLLLVFLIAKA
jgi:hypothetical protein